MTQCIERNDVVGGLFKIRGEHVNTVLQFVSEWRENDECFEYLAVRDCAGAKDNDFMVAIDFRYKLDGVNPELEHSSFFHEYTDKLRRRFGNGLAIWDVSTPVYVFE